MSRSRQEMIRCTNCHGQQGFTVWESVNVTVSPHLKQSLLNGDLTTFRCERCGNEAYVAYDLLYHDMDKSLAFWLKEEDDDDSQAAKQMFSAMTQLKTTRTVRTLHELYDKIRIFDDGFDDFEIELFKFSACIRQKMDFGLPFHYSETKTSFFGKRSLVFVFSNGGGFTTLECPFKDYESAMRPLAEKIRPLLAGPSFEWARLDRGFIFRAVEEVGLMRNTATTTTQTTIQVHTLGRTPKFEDAEKLDEWMLSGGSTYKVESWQIGKDVSADQARKYRDPNTGHLYVFYQAIDEEWKGSFVTRQKFAQLKAIEDTP